MQTIMSNQQDPQSIDPHLLLSDIVDLLERVALGEEVDDASLTDIRNRYKRYLGEEE